VYTDSIHIL